jgi:hypothetical protein
MQTETPLYVSDVLGEVDNTEFATIEPEFLGQGQPRRRGPALYVSDRRAAAKRDGEQGNFFEWLALGILAAIIVALLATTGIGTIIGNGVSMAICRITKVTPKGDVDPASTCHQTDNNGAK